MRRLKKTLIYLLAMVLCSGIFMVPVLGAVQEQDGIKVTLTTDKDTYAKGETISAVLSVENTNEEAVQNVTLKNYVPDGYKLAENAFLPPSSIFAVPERIFSQMRIAVFMMLRSMEPTKGIPAYPTWPLKLRSNSLS